MTEKFMPIPPRYQLALQMLVEQKKRDHLGAIGLGALRDEDEPLTLAQIVSPLLERGLIEDLTETELGAAGVHFVRITQMGKLCLDFGVMPREPHKATVTEIAKWCSVLPHVTVETDESILGTA